MEINNNTNYNYFALLFGQCLYIDREIASFYIGLISIICWVLCIVLNFVINCVSKKKSNLSPYLFYQWIIGDTLNLIGTILTDQLLFQKIAGVFFIIMDLLNILQYIYFSRNTLIAVSEESNELANENNELISENDEESQRQTTTYIRLSTVQKMLLTTLLTNEATAMICNVSDATQQQQQPNIIGLIIGSLASLMYISSRISCLKKIRKDKSVAGLLKTMFIFAICGNITYLTALLLKHSDNASLLNSLPWLLCSIIILCFDFVIVYHFYLYKL